MKEACGEKNTSHPEIVQEIHPAKDAVSTNQATNTAQDGIDWSTTRLELWAFYVYYIVCQSRKLSSPAFLTV